MKLSSLSYLSSTRPPLEDVCTIEVNIKVCIEFFIGTIMVHYVTIYLSFFFYNLSADMYNINLIVIRWPTKVIASLDLGFNLYLQDINDNAPIFDRANYDVPVAQVRPVPSD